MTDKTLADRLREIAWKLDTLIENTEEAEDSSRKVMKAARELEDLEYARQLAVDLMDDAVIRAQAAESRVRELEDREKNLGMMLRRLLIGKWGDQVKREAYDLLKRYGLAGTILRAQDSVALRGEKQEI